MTADDMSGEELPAGKISFTSRMLDIQRARYLWINTITAIAVIFVIIFFLSLLYFIFCGSLRGAAWIWSVDDGKWLAFADIPVIVALSSIPTLLLMALLRHYHSQPSHSEKDEESAVSSSLALQVCKEALKVVDGSKP